MSQHTTDVSPPRVPHARLVLSVMVALYFFSFFLRTAIPGTIFDELQTDLGLTALQVTGLGSMFFYIYAPMQFVVGLLADRFGGTRTLLTGAFFMLIGAGLFPFSETVGACYASRALTGFGASFMYLSIIKEIDLLFGPARFPTLLGIALGFGYAGGIAAMLPFERLVSVTGWRPALAGVAVALCVVWIVGFLALRGINHFQRPSGPLSLEPLRDVLANRRTWPLLLVSLINYPAYFVMQAGIGKKFLQDYAGLSSAASALFTMIMMGMSAALMLCAGPLLRFTHQRRKPHLYATCCLICLSATLMLVGVLARAEPLWFLFCYLLLAVSTASAPAGNATMKELHGRESIGAAIAMYNGLAYVGVAILIQIVGGVLDLFSQDADISANAIRYPPAAYATIFGILAGLSLVSMVLTWFIPETGGTVIDG